MIEFDTSNITSGSVGISLGDGSSVLQRDRDVVDIHAERVPASEVVIVRHHTPLWDKDCCLNLSPGQNSIPMNIVYDRFTEELSFSAVYGMSSTFDKGVYTTPYIITRNPIFFPYILF